ANCSILFPDFSVADAAQAAANAGYREVEFWWPFAGEEPSESEVENFARNVDEAGVRLVAINLWAGDMAAGERGVLHERALSDGHIRAIRQLMDLTGVSMGNTLRRRWTRGDRGAAPQPARHRGRSARVHAAGRAPVR